jgi:hypothetical protein
VAGQVDRPLPGGSFAYLTAQIPDLPPGDYTPLLGVYNWQTGVRLPLNTPDNLLPLDPVTIR